MQPDDQLEIERLGGLAGMGLPGSRIRSRALLAVRDMTTAEQKRIAALFQQPPAASHVASPGADQFRYRLTLTTSTGRHQIEVSAPDLLESLQDRVQDELL